MATVQLGGGELQLLDHKAENVHPATMGMAVDYLSRLANGADPGKAFRISIQGALRLHADEAVHTLDVGRLVPVPDVDYLCGEPLAWQMEHIADALTKLKIMHPGVLPDDDVIRAAVHLVGYDIAFRRGPDSYTGHHAVPDAVTISSIRMMVGRAVSFFSLYGPVTDDGFTPVNRLSRTELVNSGDGDFLTADTLWDFKVSVAPPRAIHTLQLLMYLIMCRHSGQDQFAKITHLGIFNPRLNTVFRIAFKDISQDLVGAVSREVIGYAIAS
jgi:hypothetical protein